MKTVVITGGSSGIGKATAELFARKGWQVFEWSRSGASTDTITHISCDVTKPEQTQAAAKQVIDQAGQIDVFISNAGYGISGAIEFTSSEDAHRQMEVNFFGALNSVQAVLPYMRERKAGRIIFTSSVAAVLSIPYQSFYSASKAAINALALALQNEVRAFGIYVSVLMPGDVATGFTAARKKSEEGMDAYGNIRKAVAAMEKDEQGGMSPRQMANRFYHIATCRCPAPQYVGGAQYAFFCFLDRILSKRFVNWVVGKLY
ncbi:MAG: SDR family NAD(P)-dependent oxidoreductase [Paludibacteraceae bacterium]|nr:SDR family NAD(P)-dependent oxidoreductase [Paludibacteraceae bacterium]